jgi:hypothetical protein
MRIREAILEATAETSAPCEWKCSPATGKPPLRAIGGGRP